MPPPHALQSLHSQVSEQAFPLVYTHRMEILWYLQHRTILHRGNIPSLNGMMLMCLHRPRGILPPLAVLLEGVLEADKCTGNINHINYTARTHRVQMKKKRLRLARTKIELLAVSFGNYCCAAVLQTQCACAQC